MKRILSLAGRGVSAVGRSVAALGRATIALVGICGVVAALANYTMTQGVGTNFGSIVVSTVHYAQFMLCDLGTPSQCAAVSAAGAVKTDSSATTQPVSSATLATAANQATGNTSLATIASNTGAAIPPQSPAVPIGGVSICDGANGATNPCTTPATVKAASTIPAAADKALVVGLSPNTPDPCMGGNKTNLAISQNGTSSVQLVALSGSTTIYVCSLSLIAAGATTMAITTGTGTACVTGNAAVIGSTTANIANSISFAANGGLTLGNGAGTVAKGAASSELCMILGTSVFVSGNLTYVQL